MAKLLRTRNVAYTVTVGGATQIDVTINPGYDPLRTIVYRSYMRNTGDGSYDNLMIQKLDSNTIRIRSNESFEINTIIMLHFLEFESGVTVQDIVANPSTVTISSVDISKSFIVYAGNLHSTGEQDTSQETSTARFISDTQVQVDFANGVHNCSFQVVEWEGASVSQYIFAADGSQSGLTQIDVGINAVDPAKSIVMSHLTTPNQEDTGAICLVGEFVVDLDGFARTIRFRRDRIGNISGMQSTLFVAEFSDGTLCERLPDVSLNNGESIGTLEYPTFGGVQTDPDNLSMWSASASFQVQGRNGQVSDNKDAQTVAVVSLPVTDGGTTTLERDSSTSSVTYGMWAIRPSVTGEPPPTTEEAYPGLTPAVIAQILQQTFYTEPWDLADPSLQLKALNAAAVAIDQLNYMGAVSDSAISPHQFPRGTDTVVPFDIYGAIVNEAILLLDGADPQMEHENLNQKSQGYANVRSTHDHASTQEHTLAGIMSVLAWRYLVPYLRRTEDLNILRGD